jgi:cell division protein FtsN
VITANITRQKVEIPPIVFNSTDTLPYFVTGYWYPNTSKNLKEYRSRESGGFFNQTGFIDSSGHDYEQNSSQIDKNFSSNIYEPLEKLLPAFQDFCRDTLFLKITIHGYTDPRGLSGGADHPYRPQSRNKHNYPDETVTVGLDSRGLPGTINSGVDMWRHQWPLEPGNEKGRWVKLQDEGQNGNILLSKLRAYFTFVTFDKDMQQRSPIYSQMRNNGRVILDAEGFGIDQEGYKTRKLKDDPQSRRIEIYLDILRPEEIAYHKRLPGGTMKPMATAGSAKAEPKTSGVKIETKNNEQTKELELNIEAPASEVEVKTEDVKTPEPEEAQAEPEEKTPETEGVNNTQEDPKEVAVRNVPVVPAKPLPPPVEKPKEIIKENKEKECYTIQYHIYDNLAEAESARNILVGRNVQDVRIVEILDLFGERTYRLRSGCYPTPEEAVKIFKTIEWTTKELNLHKKPVIIR